jgi:mono/diheme cytochrome c family protein
MPSFPVFAGPDLTTLEAWLAQRCADHGRTASDLYAGNCASCHGDTAGGSRNGLGDPGPDIRCTGLNDYQEKIASGGDGMPAFRSFSAGDVVAIFEFVSGSWCRGG